MNKIMNKIKILAIFGTRPEAIKMAPLIKELQKYPKRAELKICVTGQHRKMLDQVLDVFDITPDYDFNLMKANQTLFELTSAILNNIDNILQKYTPDIILVQGDTTTAFVASLAGFYKKVAIAHVEAGLRTGNLYSPWPEEANRRLISILTTLHFAPTSTSQKNLIKEGVSRNKIHITGNTGIDALFFILKKMRLNKGIQNQAHLLIQSFGYYFKKNKKIILVTGHRRESFGEGFVNITKALRIIAEKNTDIDIVYPVHLNPHVRDVVNKTLSGISNVFLLEPLDYIPFIYLMSKSYLILTDSGGIQEEAPSLGKPVLVMRDTTERSEAVKAGTVKVVGTNVKKIVNSVDLLLSNKNLYTKMAKAHNPYGDGTASKKIAKLMLR